MNRQQERRFNREAKKNGRPPLKKVDLSGVKKLDVKELKEKFEVWLNDDTRVNSGEFDGFDLLGNYVIIELFRVTTDEESQVDIYLGGVGKNIESRRDIVNQLFYPFAKVLKVGTNVGGEFENIKVGDVYMMPDSLKSLSWNQSYMEAVLKEKSNEKFVKTDNLSATIMTGIQNLQESRFEANKFAEEIRPIDLYTFKLSLTTNNFEAKIDKNKYIK